MSLVNTSKSSIRRKKLLDMPYGNTCGGKRLPALSSGSSDFNRKPVLPRSTASFPRERDGNLFRFPPSGNLNNVLCDLGVSSEAGGEYSFRNPHSYTSVLRTSSFPTMPTSSPSSTTGRVWKFLSTMMEPNSSILVSGPTVVGSGVMASATVIAVIF
jgi:hypothetical protein